MFAQGMHEAIRKITVSRAGENVVLSSDWLPSNNEFT